MGVEPNSYQVSLLFKKLPLVCPDFVALLAVTPNSQTAAPPGQPLARFIGGLEAGTGRRTRRLLVPATMSTFGRTNVDPTQLEFLNKLRGSVSNSSEFRMLAARLYGGVRDALRKDDLPSFGTLTRSEQEALVNRVRMQMLNEDVYKRCRDATWRALDAALDVEAESLLQHKAAGVGGRRGPGPIWPEVDNDDDGSDDDEESLASRRRRSPRARLGRSWSWRPKARRCSSTSGLRRRTSCYGC